MCLKRVSVHKKGCATVAYDYELFQICKNLDLGLHWAQALWANPLAILAPFSPFSRVPFRKSKKVRDSCCLTVFAEWNHCTAARPSDQQWLRPVAMFSGYRCLRLSVC